MRVIKVDEVLVMGRSKRILSNSIANFPIANKSNELFLKIALVESNVCYLRQIFEEIQANLSLFAPSFGFCCLKFFEVTFLTKCVWGGEAHCGRYLKSPDFFHSLKR